jgi:hypothetical protein
MKECANSWCTREASPRSDLCSPCRAKLADQEDLGSPKAESEDSDWTVGIIIAMIAGGLGYYFFGK